MLDNQINFDVKEGKVKLSFKRKPNLTEFLQIIFTGCLQAMKAIVAAAPAKDREKVQEELYDLFNAGASRTLDLFAPNIEMRPHLTTQAIMEAEDAIIARSRNKRVK
jgi:hypothetical protein